MEFRSSFRGEAEEAAEYSRVYIVAFGLAFREAFKGLPCFFYHLLGKRIIGVFVFAQHLEYYYPTHNHNTSNTYTKSICSAAEMPHYGIKIYISSMGSASHQLLSSDDSS